MYAAGKIPGGFIKREARPSEAAILAARLTDRPIRPLFPEGYKDDVQLVITVLSTDQENDPDVLGTVAASAALTISEIPFQGPIGAVRVGRIDGEFVVNPTYSQLAESELDLIVSGTRDAIMMVEAGAKLLPEDVMAEAILFGHRALQPLIDLQEELQGAVGKAKITAVPRARHRLGPRLRRSGRQPGRVRRRRHRDDRHRPEDGRPRRDRGGPGQGRQDRRPLVDLREPRPADRRQPDARHHRQGRQGRSQAGRGRQAGVPPFAGDAPIVGHSVGFDLGFLEAALGDGFRFEPGTLSRHAGDRPRGLPGRRELQARRPGRASSGSSSRRPTGRCPDAEATAEPPASGSPTSCRVGSPRCARGSRPRSAPTGPAATPRSCSRRRAARRGSARACSTWSTRRPAASSSSTRGSGWTAAA